MVENYDYFPGSEVPQSGRKTGQKVLERKGGGTIFAVLKTRAFILATSALC
jgi:hypothetical protein